MSAISQQPSLKEQHDLLLALQIRYHDRFVDVGFRTAATLIVFLGWLFTAKIAQEFLAHGPAWAWGLSMALALTGSLLISLMLVRGACDSRGIYRKLLAVQYFEARYLVHHELKTRVVAMVLALNLLLCTGILVSLYFLRYPA